jgi:hypothetical protein
LLASESLAHGWSDLVTGSATLATLAELDAARLPLTIRAVALGVAAFTMLPAGFVVLAPVAFVREPTPAHLAVAVASAIGYAGLAARRDADLQRLI